MAVARVPREAVAVLALLALNAAAVVATYARFPVSQLYHVHHGGVAAGFGRGLVFLNFPSAIVAVALVGLAWPRLGPRGRPLALLSLALCVVVYWAVRQSNFDVRPINAVPAAGVVLAVALVLAVGAPPAPAHVRGDPLRLALAALMILFAAPLIAAELGLYLDGVPVLGWLFETSRLTAEPGVRGLHHAVHHGDHHGWQGTLVALAALALSRLPRPRALDAYLALMLAYGIANLVNDDWLEQVVKRGWTRHEVPGVTTPAANWGWAAVLVLAAAVWLLWFRQPRRTTPAAASPAISSSA